MTYEKHIYNKMLSYSSASYHKARRGSNKSLINACEKKHYSNDFLLSKCINEKTLTSKNTKIMSKSMVVGLNEGFQTRKNAAVRSLFLSSLRDYLHSEDDDKVSAAGVSLLFNRFRAITHSLRLVAVTDKDCEDLSLTDKWEAAAAGHSYIEYHVTNKDGKVQNAFRLSALPPRVNELSAQIVSTTFAAWFSYLRGLYNNDDDVRKEYSLCHSLLGYSKGGRVAASSTEKRCKRMTKDARQMSVEEAAAALRASNLDLSALAALLAK